MGGSGVQQEVNEVIDGLDALLDDIERLYREFEEISGRRVEEVAATLPEMNTEYMRLKGEVEELLGEVVGDTYFFNPEDDMDVEIAWYEEKSAAEMSNLQGKVLKAEELGRRYIDTLEDFVGEYGSELEEYVEKDMLLPEGYSPEPWTEAAGA